MSILYKKLMPSCGISSASQMCCCCKMLGRDSTTVDMDDAYAMGESIVLECVKEFTQKLLTSMWLSI
jgi:hypothetical protein